MADPSKSLALSPPNCCRRCSPTTVFAGGVWPASFQVEFSGNTPWNSSAEPIGLNSVHSDWVVGGFYGTAAVHAGQYLSTSRVVPRACDLDFVATFVDHNSTISPIEQCWISAVLGDSGTPGVACAARYTYTGPTNGLHFQHVRAATASVPHFNILPYTWNGSAWIPYSGDWIEYEDEDLRSTLSGGLTIVELTTGRRLGFLGVAAAPDSSGGVAFLDLGSSPLDPAGTWSGDVNLGVSWADRASAKPAPLFSCGSAAFSAEGEAHNCFSLGGGTVTITGLP